MSIKGSATRRQRLQQDRWQLVVLTIPLMRALLYLAGLAPGQVAEAVLPKAVQTIAVVLLGLAGGTALFGVLRERPIIERAGLDLLWPVSAIYGLVLVAADWHRAVLWVVVYLLIAAAARSRSGEITRSMRLTNKLIRDAHTLEDGGQP